MKKILFKYGSHVLFPFLIFIFVARLCSLIQQYREAIFSLEKLDISILSMILIIILLSISYGVLIGRSFGSDSANITAKPAEVKEIKEQ